MYAYPFSVHTSEWFLELISTIKVIWQKSGLVISCNCLWWSISSADVESGSDFEINFGILRQFVLNKYQVYGDWWCMHSNLKIGNLGTYMYPWEMFKILEFGGKLCLFSHKNRVVLLYLASFLGSKHFQVLMKRI